MDAVIKVMEDEDFEILRQTIRAVKPLAVMYGASRPAMYPPKILDRFFWPYVLRTVRMIVEEGALCYFHYDANWERHMDRFLECPKGKCVFGSDSATDIYKLKEKLDGHMCLMADVSPSLLALGTPDEVYKRCTKLINEIGPNGYILSQSCTIPANAKPENVVAMLAAATGK
jgi:uroporphyrinogen-III decarboxylase